MSLVLLVFSYLFVNLESSPMKSASIGSILMLRLATKARSLSLASLGPYPRFPSVSPVLIHCIMFVASWAMTRVSHTSCIALMATTQATVHCFACRNLSLEMLLTICSAACKYPYTGVIPVPYLVLLVTL